MWNSHILKCLKSVPNYFFPTISIHLILAQCAGILGNLRSTLNIFTLKCLFKLMFYNSPSFSLHLSHILLSFKKLKSRGLDLDLNYSVLCQFHLLFNGIIPDPLQFKWNQNQIFCFSTVSYLKNQKMLAKPIFILILQRHFPFYAEKTLWHFQPGTNHMCEVINPLKWGFLNGETESGLALVSQM